MFKAKGCRDSSSHESQMDALKKLSWPGAISQVGTSVCLPDTAEHMGHIASGSSGRGERGTVSREATNSKYNLQSAQVMPGSGAKTEEVWKEQDVSASRWHIKQ